MKRIVAISTVLFILTACDPINVGELRNNTGAEIEIKVCGQSLSYINHDNSGIELPQADSARNCKTIKLDKGKIMPIATASGISAPIKYSDLEFDQIEITTEKGKIRATGKEIMNLFDIEEQTNLIGIHTHDLFLIEVE